MIEKSIKKISAHADIKLLLDYSHKLYKEYLKSDKKFIYASILRKVNHRLYEQLQDSIVHLKESSHADVLDLMFHLDVWMTIWDYKYEEQKPLLSDVFTFDNDINFPKDSVKNLLSDLAEFCE
jgi:hypothetical protein